MRPDRDQPASTGAGASCEQRARGPTLACMRRAKSTSWRARHRLFLHRRRVTYGCSCCQLLGLAGAASCLPASTLVIRRHARKKRIMRAAYGQKTRRACVSDATATSQHAQVPEASGEAERQRKRRSGTGRERGEFVERGAHEGRREAADPRARGANGLGGTGARPA